MLCGPGAGSLLLPVPACSAGPNLWQKSSAAGFISSYQCVNSQNPEPSTTRPRGRQGSKLIIHHHQLPLNCRWTRRRAQRAQITGAQPHLSPRSNLEQIQRAERRTASFFRFLCLSLVLAHQTDGQLRLPDCLTGRLTNLRFVHCGQHTPGVSCLLPLVLSLVCGLDSISKQSASGAAPAASQPIRSDQQSRGEPEHSVSKVTSNSHAASQSSWAERARLQSQFDEIRINRPLESISHPPPAATHTSSHLVSPFVVAAANPFPSCSSSCRLLSLLTNNPPPIPPARQRMRCAVHADSQTEPSRGESRPLSARLLLSPLPLFLTGHRLLQSTSRCESGSSVRAQQQIDWPSACNNIGSTDHFRPVHHHPAVPIFTPCCCCRCYCCCLLLLLCCRCLD